MRPPVTTEEVQGAILALLEERPRKTLGLVGDTGHSIRDVEEALEALVAEGAVVRSGAMVSLPPRPAGRPAGHLPDSNRSRILALLAGSPWRSLREITEHLGKPRGVSAWLKGLHDRGEVVRIGAGGPADGYRYALPGTPEPVEASRPAAVVADSVADTHQDTGGAQPETREEGESAGTDAAALPDRSAPVSAPENLTEERLAGLLKAAGHDVFYGTVPDRSPGADAPWCRWGSTGQPVATDNCWPTILNLADGVTDVGLAHSYEEAVALLAPHLPAPPAPAVRTPGEAGVWVDREPPALPGVLEADRLRAERDSAIELGARAANRHRDLRGVIIASLPFDFEDPPDDVELVDLVREAIRAEEPQRLAVLLEQARAERDEGAIVLQRLRAERATLLARLDVPEPLVTLTASVRQLGGPIGSALLFASPVGLLMADLPLSVEQQKALAPHLHTSVLLQIVPAPASSPGLEEHDDAKLRADWAAIVAKYKPAETPA